MWIHDSLKPTACDPCTEAWASSPVLYSPLSRFYDILRLREKMWIFVAVTDNDWFALHASLDRVEEVSFWRPSPEATFKALQPGEVLLFKLHAPLNYIAGGGFFVRFIQSPVNLDRDTFKYANGVQSLAEMRDRIAFYTRSGVARFV